MKIEKHDVQGIEFSSLLYNKKYACVDFLSCPQTIMYAHFANKGFEKQHKMLFQELTFLKY